MKLTIHCCMCSKKTEHEFDLSKGWAHQYSGIDDEQSGFCPDHADIAEFTDSQCPGCVGGWGECGLWKDFAFRGQSKLTSGDFAMLERGVCPRRVNGTFDVLPDGVTDIDLSETAQKAGVSLAAAIRDYWLTYPD